jgi:hypothetical protein
MDPTAVIPLAHRHRSQEYLLFPLIRFSGPLFNIAPQQTEVQAAERLNIATSMTGSSNGRSIVIIDRLTVKWVASPREMRHQLRGEAGESDERRWRWRFCVAMGSWLV